MADNLLGRLKSTQCCDPVIDGMLGAAIEEIQRLQQWVSDLQSGMFVNCVYCGHRYGPDDGSTPVTMAEVLTEHVKVCPKHPMSKMRRALETIQLLIERFDLTTPVFFIDKISQLADAALAGEELPKIMISPGVCVHEPCFYLQDKLPGQTHQQYHCQHEWDWPHDVCKKCGWLQR